MRTKVATALLRQRDPRQRRALIVRSSVVFLLLFVAHTYFTNLTSPMKLIPQMFTAVMMGYVLLYVQSLRRFDYAAEFIDWAKVEAAVEPGAAKGGTRG